MKQFAMFTAAAVTSIIGVIAFAQTTPPTIPSTSSPPVPSPSTQLSIDTFYAPQLTRANWRSTELVGKPVYNGNDERIGEIDELVLSNDGRVVAAIVGVGGFQGMAERKVSIAFPDIKMMRDSNGTARVSVDLSREMLQSAPEFKAPKMN